MTAYQMLYPYAVIAMAIVAALMTIISGGVGWMRLMAAPLPPLDKSQWDTQTGQWVGRIMLATSLFVGACLAAMLELKFGAVITGVGCAPS